MGDHAPDRAGGPLTPAPADTIAAPATPPGRGGIGVIRVSGPAAAAVARGLLGRVPEPRRATFTAFRDAAGTVLDRGLALWFPAPATYTGEDVLELHGHGGPVVMDLLLARCLELGARPARPGEFTERAFLNGKMDLAEAEAVADLIDAASREAACGAVRSLEGAFSREVRALSEALTELRVHVEAALDFPDEDLDTLGGAPVAARLDELRAGLERLRARASAGAALREGLTVAVVGRPNVGKSSLLNRLARRDVASGTEIPGTTRDVLRETGVVAGIPLTVLDTAGLRDSADPVEREGVERARRALESADHVLLVTEDGQAPEAGERDVARAAAGRLTVVRNKIDLSGRAPGLADGPWGPEVAISARTGAGIDALEARLQEVAGGRSGGEGVFTARRRHLEALARAADALARAAGLLDGGSADLVAEEFACAQRALGEITGEVTSEDLLERIFRTFCIGK